jgi:hypothetical protein
MWQVVANITLLMIAYGVTLSGIMLLDLPRFTQTEQHVTVNS